MPVTVTRHVSPNASASCRRRSGPGSSSPRRAPIAARASREPVGGQVVGALDAVDDLGVGAAVARQQPRALELERERRQRVREHVVHLARHAAALGGGRRLGRGRA